MLKPVITRFLNHENVNAFLNYICYGSINKNKDEKFQT